MRKRLIALMCIVMSAMSFIPSGVMAEDSSKTKKEELNALGIATPISVRVKNDEFLKALSGFFYEEEDIPKQLETVARNTGMIDEDEKYKGNENLHTQTALKYAVIALGYKKAVEGRGGSVNDYVNMASELSLTDGLSFSEDSVLASGDAIRILYNMLDCEPMLSYYSSTDNKGYSVAEGETLLSVNRDIKEVSGIITKNSQTALTKPEGAGEGYIEIGEKSYKNSYANADEFLGMRIKAYVKSDKKEEDTVLYVKEHRNNILEIDAEDIEYVDGNFSYITYLTEDGSKTKNARLKIALDVIYNGKVFPDYKETDLMPDVGGLVLIDHDMDNTYDVVKVTSYETMVVDAVSTTSKTIENKYSFSGALTILDLYPESEEVSYKIYKDGAEVEIGAIKAGDVLSVARSKNDGDKLVTIYVSTERLTSSVSGINFTEKEITLSGKIYEISDAFVEFSKESSADTLAVGDEYLFYFDYFNNAVYYKKTTDSEYYLFHKIYADDSGDKYYISYMDMNLEWYTSEIAKNPKYNNQKSTEYALYELIRNEKIQLVKLKRNTSGQVKNIEFAEETTGYDEKKFTKTPEKQLRYRSTPRFFQNISSLDEIIHLTDTAKVMIIPANMANIKTNVSIYDTASYFISDKDYPITAYDMDEYGFTDLLVITESDNVKDNGVNYTLFVVTDISTVVDADDEVVRVVTGNMGDFRNISFNIKNDTILPGVTAGDIINVHLNNKLEIDYGVIVHSLNNTFLPYSVSGGVYIRNGTAAGTIQKIDLEGKKINVLCGTVSYSFSLRNTPSVQIYNARSKTCEIGSLSDLRKRNKAVCRVSWGQLQEIVMIEEE